MSKLNSLIYCIFFTALCFSCSTSQKNTLRHAEYCYHKFEYSKAIPYYLAVHNLDSIVFTKLGDCYLLTDTLTKAKKYYKKALSYSNCPPIVTRNYASVCMQLGEYDSAKHYLEMYRKTDSSDRRVMNMIHGCDSASYWLNEIPVGYAKCLDLNTNNNEFAPTLWRGNALVFAADTAYGIKKNIDNWTGASFFNMYKVGCDLQGNCDTNFQLLCPSTGVNTRYHDGPCTFSANGNVVYFTRSRSKNERPITSKDSTVLLEIMMVEFDSTTHEYARTIKFTHNSKMYSVAFPTVSPDGNTLVFSSNKPGGSGAYDLYMCRKTHQKDAVFDTLFKLSKFTFYVGYDELNAWSNPKNLGKVVNTEGEEVYPYFADDTTLFFSSDGHPGLGGLDIYKIKFKYEPRSDSVIITEPERIKIPINSSKNDVSLALFADGRNSYFSSNRFEPKNAADNIYFFRQKKLFVQIDVTDGMVPLKNVQWTFKGNGDTFSAHNDAFSAITDSTGKILRQLHIGSPYQYSIHASLPGYESVDILNLKYISKRDIDTIFERIVVHKHVIDKRKDTCKKIFLNLTVKDTIAELPIADVEVRVHNDLSAERIDLYNTCKLDPSGQLSYNLTKNTGYLFEILTPGYTTQRFRLDSVDCRKDIDVIISKDIYLQHNDTFEVVVRFGFDSSIITDSAGKSLDILIKYMSKKPKCHLQFIANADCRGDDKYNLLLSERRAKSVHDYLVTERGIANERIDAYWGRGETRPKITCCNCQIGPRDETTWNELIKKKYLVGKNKEKFKKISDKRKVDELNCRGDVRCSETDHFLNRRIDFILIHKME